MISHAMRKYHPATHDRIELYTSFGMLAGSSRRLNLSHPRPPNDSIASFESSGMVLTAS